MQWVSLQIGRKSAFIEFNYVRRQTPPGRSEVLPVLRLLQRDLKIALVLGVIRIGVKGFFFGLLPGFLLALYEKHGQPLEVVVRQIVECCFIQPKERPYQTNNAYTALVRQSQMEKEVNAIVQKAKERNERKSAGQAHPRRKERDSGRHPKV